MSEQFKYALNNDRRLIFDALKHPNPFARTRVLGLMIEYKAFDDEFVQAVIPLLNDQEITVFGMKVGDVAKDYLLEADKLR